MPDEPLIGLNKDAFQRMARAVLKVERTATPQAKIRRRQYPNRQNSLVHFVLSSVDCVAQTAVGTADLIQKGGTLPNEPQPIRDDDGCWLVGNPNLLTGLKCWCVETIDPYTGEDYFSILALCCNGCNCG